jgi:hypothetical protein
VQTKSEYRKSLISPAVVSPRRIGSVLGIEMKVGPSPLPSLSFPS